MKACDFVYCSDNLFNAGDLAALEGIVLETLDWRLARPAIVDFIDSFVEAFEIGQDALEMLLLKYLSQLALQSQIHRYHQPSFIAACIVVLARFCHPDEKPLWKEEYENLTGYTFQEVCEGVVSLSTRLDEIRVFVPSVDVIDRQFLKLADGRHDGTVPSITSSSMLIAHQRRVTSHDFVPTTDVVS